MKELVEYIVKSLVEHPEQVRVKEVSGRSATVIEVKVASTDTGRVIGKGGRVVNAMRTLVQTRAASEGERVNVEII